MHSNSIVQTMTFDTDNECAMQYQTEVSINNLRNPSIVSRVGHGFRLTRQVSGSGCSGKGCGLLGSWTWKNPLLDNLPFWHHSELKFDSIQGERSWGKAGSLIQLFLNRNQAM
jgi:hypothetical protein